MDVLNKFYSTVSSTVSQLSSVLPGNPLTREYEVTSHIASAGPGLLWKVYSGYKKSTKQAASIFVFEKRQVVPAEREQVLEMLRRGVTQLTKLRHPQILVVQHPLEESRDCLAFATEPVFASLANVLGETDNMPSSNEHLKNYRLYDIEIKYGLLQVSEGLCFLHKDAKIVHHNICPRSIVLNQQGAWKIFGFDFAAVNTSTDATVCKWTWIDWSAGCHQLCQPDLDYLAPECGLSSTLQPASDIFSLGMTISCVYNSGQTLFPHANNTHAYKNNMAKLKTVNLSKLSFVAEGLREMVKLMLSSTPELRPDLHDFLKIGYFEDVGVKALNYLDSLFQWDNRQKSHFYKGLPQILDKLPHRVSLYRVVPCLVKEFVNPMMVPFVLPNIFLITENCTKQEFITHILPHLKPVLALQEPIQILVIVMQKMGKLIELLSGSEDVTQVLLPVLYRALESDVVEMQELTLSVLPSLAPSLDLTSVKNHLLPRIKRLCLSTSTLSVRVNCLLCVGKLIDYLDKWVVMDDVLPFLPQIPSREPAVLMAILGIYKLVLGHKAMGLSKEVMAAKVIPFLMPLAIENSLSLNQFNSIISTIKDMVSRVEQEHRVKLQQLHAQQPSTTPTSASNSSFESSISEKDKVVTGPSIQELEELFGIESKPRKQVPLEQPKPAPQKPPSQPLSLNDKSRLVSEGESNKKLMASGGQLTPTLVSSQTQRPQQPKDLTANLIGKNMMGLSMGTKAGGTTTGGGGGMQIRGVTSQSNDWNNWQTTPSNNSQTKVDPLDPAEWQWGNSNKSSKQPGVGLKPQPQSTSTSSNGWAPWSLSATQTPSTKPLSSSEINDFLS